MLICLEGWFGSQMSGFVLNVISGADVRFNSASHPCSSGCVHTIGSYIAPFEWGDNARDHRFMIQLGDCIQ